MDLKHYGRLLQCLKNTHHALIHCKQLHLLFLKNGVLNSTLSIANSLLQVYSKCGAIQEAQNLFAEMPNPNCFSWNTLLEGYFNLGFSEKSLEIFNLMPHKNEFSWNFVISGFAKKGRLEIARKLFNAMPEKNGIAWNSMIHGFAREGCAREAVVLFKDLCGGSSKMNDDTFVMATVIRALVDLQGLSCGKQIHARILINNLEIDSVLQSSLINLYGKCGDLQSANFLLNMMREPDDFSLSALISGYANCGRMDDAKRIFLLKLNPGIALWNSIIAGYIYNNDEDEALRLFVKLRRNGVREDCSTFTCVLCACGSLGALGYGKQIHVHSFKAGVLTDVILASALVDMYSKCKIPGDGVKLFTELKVYDTVLLNSMITLFSSCGRIEDAKQIFRNMRSKSLISWNSMIAGFSQNGCPFEALDLFLEMNVQNLKVDKFSLASVISACASLSLLPLGEQIFARATTVGLGTDQIVTSSLVDLYCKCGYVENGRKLFDEIIEPDEVLWNSMLMGFATNGHGSEALNLFNQMTGAGIIPSDITFTGVLSACDHCGLVDEGRECFRMMKLDYHINPGVEHYSCMIDLLARAGHLDEAMNLIEQMPFKVDASMLSSVLRGCKAHGHKTLGKKVAGKIIEIDPENSGAYVQLSSMFADSGDWDISAQFRKIMREKHIQKNPGHTWGDGFVKA